MGSFSFLKSYTVHIIRIWNIFAHVLQYGIVPIILWECVYVCILAVSVYLILFPYMCTNRFVWIYLDFYFVIRLFFFLLFFIFISFYTCTYIYFYYFSFVIYSFFYSFFKQEKIVLVMGNEYTYTHTHTHINLYEC